MSYSRLLLKVVAREPIAWVSFGALAVLLSLCAFLPYPLYGPELLKLTLRMNYESLSQSISSGSLDGAPDDLVESMRARVEYMDLALNAETNHDFYRALSNIYAIDEAQSSSGSLVGTSPLEEAAKKEYADAMAMVDGSTGYDYSNQLPGILLFTVAPSTLPQFALSIPAIAIAFCISSATDRRKLLGSATIPAGTSLLSRCLVGVVLSAIGLCAAIIPPLPHRDQHSRFWRCQLSDRIPTRRANCRDGRGRIGLMDAWPDGFHLALSGCCRRLHLRTCKERLGWAWRSACAFTYPERTKLLLGEFNLGPNPQISSLLVFLSMGSRRELWRVSKC